MTGRDIFVTGKCLCGKKVEWDGKGIFFCSGCGLKLWYEFSKAYDKPILMVEYVYKIREQDEGR